MNFFEKIEKLKTCNIISLKKQLQLSGKFFAKQLDHLTDVGWLCKLMPYQKKKLHQANKIFTDEFDAKLAHKIVWNFLAKPIVEKCTSRHH